MGMDVRPLQPANIQFSFFYFFGNILFLKIISEIEEDRENNGEKRRLEKRFNFEIFSLHL